MKAGSERCDEDRENRRKRRSKMKKKGAWRNEKRREGGGGLRRGSYWAGATHSPTAFHKRREPAGVGSASRGVRGDDDVWGPRLELTGGKVDEGDQSFPCNQIDCVSDP